MRDKAEVGKRKAQVTAQGKPRHRFFFLLPPSAFLLGCALALSVCAQPYPSRPVRMIIPSGAGGITDILGRVLAQKLSESFGQQVVIDNRPGASGVVGSGIVARAPPDG